MSSTLLFLRQCTVWRHQFHYLALTISLEVLVFQLSLAFSLFPEVLHVIAFSIFLILLDQELEVAQLLYQDF